MSEALGEDQDVTLGDVDLIAVVPRHMHTPGKVVGQVMNLVKGIIAGILGGSADEVTPDDYDLAPSIMITAEPDQLEQLATAFEALGLPTIIRLEKDACRNATAIFGYIHSLEARYSLVLAHQHSEDELREVAEGLADTIRWGFLALE